MDAIVPLTLACCTRARELLIPSLERHYRDLETLWVVSPRGELRAVSAAIRDADAKIRIAFLADEEVVPELVLHARLGFPRVNGWYRQQLIKLAMADHVTSDFYLTLDDDVLAVSDFGDGDCIVENRALRGQDRAGYLAQLPPRIAQENLNVWLMWSARVLCCAPLDYQPEVTPSILSRSAVRQLAVWLDSHNPPTARRWRLSALLGAITGWRALRSWRGRLLAHLPWTEYTLYDTFLVRHSGFADHHRPPTDTLLLGNAAWNAAQFEGWQPRGTDDAGRRLLFNLVASRSTITVADVATRLRASPAQAATKEPSP